MFKTRLTEILGVEYPIIGGAMAYLSTPELAAAVSNAGGFGLIGAVSCESKQELREMIRRCRELTDKPFGVNIALITRDPNRIKEDMEVVVEEKVKFVETAALNPEPFLKQLKNAGITVLHKCATVRHAKSAERAGADAITLVGYEAAGHTGLEDLPHSILIPLAVDALSVPIIAAGGVGDGRAFVAALALGASGVQIGTRLMASKECPASDRFKQWLIDTEATDTVHVERSLNRAYRVRRNEAAEKVLEMEREGTTFLDLLPYIGGERYRAVLFGDDVEVGLCACGPVAGLIEDVPSAGEIIDRIVSQAREIVSHLYTS